MNHYQASYEHREAVKREAWAILARPDTSIEQKASAALDLIGSHYGRAMEGRGGNARLSPDFNTYAQHWLWANGEQTLPIDVLRFLMVERGLWAKQSKRLPKGQTSYVQAPKREL